jgi:hypothetical protein
MSVSGIVIPAVKSGWRRVGIDDFTQNTAVGSWTGSTLLQPRPDAARDGTYKDSSGRAIYSSKRTTSQHDGLLDIRLFQDANGQRYAGSPITKSFYPSLRVTGCLRVDAPEPGWKLAHLVAVGGNNVSSRGEYDFPECKLTDAPAVNAFCHQVGGAQLSKTVKSVTGKAGEIYRWHTYTIEVVSGKSVTYEFDGKVILKVTSGITAEQVHWVLQNETYLSGQTIPAKMGEAHVLIDWVTLDVPA